jgi:hypothetical protein
MGGGIQASTSKGHHGGVEVATLKDILEKNKRASQRWFDKLDAKNRKEMDQLVADFHAGKYPDHTSVSIGKTIKEYFKLTEHVKTIGDYVREHRPS